MKKIFFGPATGISHWAFADLINSKEIEYVSIGKLLDNKIAHILTSSKIITKIPNFIKFTIYKLCLGYKFLNLSRKENILFVFSDVYELFSDPNRLFPFLDFLRQWFINSKFAIYKYEAVHHISIKYLPDIINHFDKCLTYNKFDSQKYDLEYYGPICENGFIEQTGDVEECDIFYSGGVGNRNNNRLSQIINIFISLSEKGLKCIFYINDLNNKEIDNLLSIGDTQIDNGILYKGSKFYWTYCAYSRNLAYYKQCKAVLEFIWPQTLASCTMRMAQVLANDKKLITNSLTVKDEPFYHPENILYFEKPEDISRQWLETPMVDDDYDFSPTHMVEVIEKRLTEQ